MKILIRIFKIMVFTSLGIMQGLAYFSLFGILLHEPSITNTIVFVIVLPCILFITHIYICEIIDNYWRVE